MGKTGNESNIFSGKYESASCKRGKPMLRVSGIVLIIMYVVCIVSVFAFPGRAQLWLGVAGILAAAVFGYYWAEDSLKTGKLQKITETTLNKLRRKK